MELSLITRVDEWKSLEPEWNQLVAGTFRPYPFLEFWYLHTWWETLGGGEWSQEDSELQIVSARQNNRLVGVAPLFSSSKPGAQSALRFIGQVEVTDYLDFICLPGELEVFLRHLLPFLQKEGQNKTRRMELANFQSDSPAISILESLCIENQHSFEKRVLQPSPSIHLPSTWDDYLGSLSKKQRHEIRRKERNLERDYTAEMIFKQDQPDIAVEMAAFFDLMRNEEQKARFLTPQTEKFMTTLAIKAQSAGSLNIASLLLEGKQAAIYLNFIDDNKLWVYNTGWDPQFASASPGWALLVKLIRWAIEQGLDEVDLMRGGEDYKYRFGGIDRQVVEVVSERS